MASQLLEVQVKLLKKKEWQLLTSVTQRSRYRPIAIVSPTRHRTRSASVVEDAPGRVVPHSVRELKGGWDRILRGPELRNRKVSGEKLIVRIPQAS